MNILLHSGSQNGCRVSLPALCPATFMDGGDSPSLATMENIEYRATEQGGLPAKLSSWRERHAALPISPIGREKGGGRLEKRRGLRG